jgi:metal-responsive CopG/Arc/MetJ family transcriptional regulator
MAKFEIDIPADLIWKVDRAAHRANETREGFLRRVVEEAVAEDGARLRQEMEDLLDSHQADLGGKTAAELVREGRDNR